MTKVNPGLTGSADGFQVVIGELYSASSAFGGEPAVFQAIMPKDGPPCPDGGSPLIDTALQDSVHLIGWLHGQVALVIGQYAQKLQAAADRYATTETSLAQLAGDLTRAASD